LIEVIVSRFGFNLSLLFSGALFLTGCVPGMDLSTYVEATHIKQVVSTSTATITNTPSPIILTPLPATVTQQATETLIPTADIGPDYGYPVGDFEYIFLLTDSRKGEPDHFIQPLEFQEVELNNNIATRYFFVNLAITELVELEQEHQIEMGFIFEDKLFSYRVEFGGAASPTDTSKLLTMTSLYPEGYLRGMAKLGCEPQARTLSLEEIVQHLAVGDVIQVGLPIEPRNDPPKGFEFWANWFYPQVDRINELLPGMYEFVKFVETGKGPPPNPEEIILYVTLLKTISKTGCVR
jgi:hypothetical protein